MSWKINGPYFFNADPFKRIEQVERKIFLQLINAINDQGFYQYVERGGNGTYSFEKDELGYVIYFDGCPLKLVFNITDNRFYFRYEKRLIDAFVLKTWQDIDDWINGKNFNISDIRSDKLFKGHDNGTN